jgi:hypothetical protein
LAWLLLLLKLLLLGHELSKLLLLLLKLLLSWLRCGALWC